LALAQALRLVVDPSDPEYKSHTGGIISLLEKMQKKSAENGKEDSKLYAKFKCWFDGLKEDKEASIKEAQNTIDTSGARITELLGENGSLSQDIADLQSQMDSLKQQMKEAKAIREKAKKAFDLNVKDSDAAIDAMGKAIETLSAVGGDQTALVSVSANVVQNLNLALSTSKAMLLAQSSEIKKVQQYTELLQGRGAGFTGTYSAQSGEIVGVIKSMRDTYVNNLADAKTTEKKAVEGHKKLMDNKQNEHDTAEDSFGKKNDSLSKNNTELETERNKLDEAKKTFKADTALLEEATEAYETKTAMYQEHKKLRAEQDAAVSEAIAMLNSDDAMALFTGMDSKFIQTKQESTHDRVTKKLFLLAEKTNNNKFAKLALLVKENGNGVVMPFEKLFIALDQMLVGIKKEGEEDKKKKTTCEKERKDHNDKITKAKKGIEEMENTIKKAKSDKKDSEDVIDGENKKISKSEKSIKEATEDRLEESKEHTKAMVDNTMGQKLIKKAGKVLAGFFNDKMKKVTESHVGKKDFEGQSAEVKEAMGKAYQDTAGDRSSAGDIILKEIENLTDDLVAEAQEEMKTESEAQKAYNKTVTDEKAAIKACKDTISSEKENIAKYEKILTGSEESLTGHQKTKKNSEEYLESIKEECDFIKDNFEFRETSRKSQTDGIKEVRTMLEKTPAHTEAVASRRKMALGKCADACTPKDTQENTPDCQACLAGTTVATFCAGQKQGGVIYDGC
jgi:chromosome segregation ATPase